MKTRILFLITLLCAVIAGVQSLHAATITVMNNNDSGAGSLRQALADAHDGDTIDFNLTYPATITLTSGELTVDKDVTISGPGAANLAVSGNVPSHVFYVSPGKTVTIDGLTITNGFLLGGLGGGIYNDHAALTVSNSTITGNSGPSAGGIFNDRESGSATLTVTNSTLSGNSAVNGGGIINENATLTVSNSTFSGNSATNLSDGGGIYNEGFSGSATVTIGNTILNAGSSGDNIFNSDGTVTSNGYNLSSDDARLLLNQLTDQNLTDPKLGPLQDNGGPTFTHALCTATGVPDASCTGASPAIDQGKNFTTATTDQRGTGFARTVDLGFPKPTGGDGTDIGAFEVQAPPVCPQPQGYWKNNPDAWPASALPMTLGSQSYTKPELLTILKMKVGSGPKADASLIVADQLIAAKLNVANGADGTPVSSTIDDANAVLSLYTGKLPYRVRPNSTNGHQMVNDAATLESFNKGFLTPGCGG